VDGIKAPQGMQTQQLVRQLLENRLPLTVFARMQQVAVSVIDAGVAENLAAHEHLLVRKIAHGTRNVRVGPAMSVDQAHAAIRAGMEMGDKLPGNVLLCAGVGVGSRESAALVLSRLVDCPVRDLLLSGPGMSAEQFSLLMTIAQGAQSRHRDVTDPVEVLAAFGGFEIAMMAGVMLVAASKRHLIMVDGLPALAALMLASRIAPPVTDYCVFCRSHQHQGLDQALGLFRASALLELGMDSTDGTGAALAWPLVSNAAALLTDVPEGEDAGPTLPQPMDTQAGNGL
jgi:nicotinate-nucleotide--dimethylbenzimidazole phosphoribosyltransferase